MKYFLILSILLASSVFAEEFKGKTVIFTFKEKGAKVKENHQGVREEYEIEFPNDFKSALVVKYKSPIKRSQLKKEFNEIVKQITIPVDKKSEKLVYKKNRSVSLGEFRGYEYSYYVESKDKKTSQLQVYLCLEIDGQLWDFQCHSSNFKDLGAFREFVKAIKFIKKK